MSIQASKSEQSNPTTQHESNSCHQESIFLFAVTTLLGAFLVFQVQPVISKCVLPWFGGTPAVWTTCMLFFQLLLFAGYVYAHLLRTWIPPVGQAIVHLGLLSAAAFALPIEPSAEWKPSGNESPIPYLLLMLAAHVGLPYFVLSSTGPLVQAWLSYRDGSQRVYRLYALSNAGSLFALLSYPFLVEPFLTVSNQSITWSLMFLGFVLSQGWLAVRLLRGTSSLQRAETADGQTHESRRQQELEAVTWWHRLAWIGLPAMASTMLLVVTNHVCQDIAVIPLLWVLPLSLYLLSFIICFDSPQWYQPKWISGLTLLAILTIQCKHLLPGSFRLIAEAGSYLTMLFGVCLLCHGETARLKPGSSLLTQYYMLLSAGGALGGLIIAVLCPLALSTHLELPISLALVTAMTFLIFFASRGWRSFQYDWAAAYRLRLAAAALTIAPLVTLAVASQDQIIASERNFFGVLQVIRDSTGTRLVHGNTIHGMQRPEPFSQEPTTYYGRSSGVGRTIEAMQEDATSLEIGVVGLGCGVLASYGRTSDQFDMIEINPAVIDIANQHFDFLTKTKADIRSHLGDGRLVLERMTNRRFDLLVLDAFSSDAIPAHLLTREAMGLYANRLAEDGVLAIHVSNNHLDLVPLVHRLAADSGFASRVVRSNGDPKLGTKHATWVVMTPPNHRLWQQPSMSVAQPASKEDLVNAPLWTDQHHNLVSVLRLW